MPQRRTIADCYLVLKVFIVKRNGALFGKYEYIPYLLGFAKILGSYILNISTVLFIQEKLCTFKS